MSAMLSPEDLQPVGDLIERVQNVQRAIKDLHVEYAGDAEFCVAVTQPHNLSGEVPIAHTHRLSYWVVMQGLAAMERELLKQLEAKEITVESVLPIAELA